MKLDLVPLKEMAESSGMSEARLARQLRLLEKSFKRKLVHGGGKQGSERLVDRGYLRRVMAGPGKSFESRLDAIEQDMTEVKNAMHEHLGVAIGK